MRPGAGPATLAALVALACAVPWIAPRDPGLQEDVAGARLLPPLTRAHALAVGVERTWIVIDLARTAQGWRFKRAGQDIALPADRLAGPPAARFYLLGTDALGRDLTSLLLFGLRHSIFVTGLSVAFSLLIGLVVGAAAGLAGGAWDAALMRGTDAVMSIPRLVIVLAAVAAFRPSTALVVAILAGTTWTGAARLVRGEILVRRRSEPTLAAIALGATWPRLLRIHLLPAIAPVLAVTAALGFADTLLLESALSFLGLGSPPPAVSLGGIVASGRESLAEGWWVVAWPGLSIAAMVLVVRAAAGRLFRVTEPASIL